MSAFDTITALASGSGRSARALIRLSGPGVPMVLARWFVEPPASPGAHRARLRLHVEQDGETDVPCLLLVFGAPRSYTGEHAAEIILPGHPSLIQRVLDQFLSEPHVRSAEPGEFTARAFLNDKMPLEQAEGVQAAIAARSASELHAAKLLLSGDAGRAYRELAEEVARLLALVEAGIDFTDQEDVVPIDVRDLGHGLRNCVFGLECFLGPATDEAVQSEPRVVLAGPPNAGKSTLFNALLSKARAVVSGTPGTTRDAIEDSLDSTRLGAGPDCPDLRLVDLAGLDEALALRSSIDAEAQAKARAQIDRADVILFCDPSGRFEPSMLPSTGARVIRVRTKADLPRAAGTEGSEAAVAVCALDGWNLDALRRAIVDAALAETASSAGTLAVVPRQRRALRAAREAFRRALDASGQCRGPVVQSPEVVAGEMRIALDALGEIVGKVTPDDVLGRVFALFCVGK